MLFSFLSDIFSLFSSFEWISLHAFCVLTKKMYPQVERLKRKKRATNVPQEQKRIKKTHCALNCCLPLFIYPRVIYLASRFTLISCLDVAYSWNWRQSLWILSNEHHMDALHLFTFSYTRSITCTASLFLLERRKKMRKDL